MRQGLLVVLVLVLAGIVACRSTPAVVARPSAGPRPPMPPIVFEWKERTFTTNVGVSGALLDHETRPGAEIRDLPDGAVVSGDVDGDHGAYDVRFHANLSSLSLDAIEAPFDPLSRFTITLADGRTGTTSLPPFSQSRFALAKWLAKSTSGLSFGETASDSSPRDSMVYIENGWFTVRLNETKITVHDRRTGRVLETKSWPAPKECPEIGGAEDTGPSMIADSPMPHDEMRAWLAAWMRANAHM